MRRSFTKSFAETSCECASDSECPCSAWECLRPRCRPPPPPPAPPAPPPPPRLRGKWKIGCECHLSIAAQRTLSRETGLNDVVHGEWIHDCDARTFVLVLPRRAVRVDLEDVSIRRGKDGVGPLLGPYLGIRASIEDEALAAGSLNGHANIFEAFHLEDKGAAQLAITKVLEAVSLLFDAVWDDLLGGGGVHAAAEGLGGCVAYVGAVGLAAGATPGRGSTS
eukprot:6213971-Pleurochrysis_carterae.AAC.2